MTTSTGERQTLMGLGEESGWGHRVSGDNADVYTKATVRISVSWAGDEVSGATLFHDGMYESYTREPATIRAWFKR